MSGWRPTDSSQMKSCNLRMGWVSTSSTTDRDRRLSTTPGLTPSFRYFCWYGPVLGGQGPLDLISLPKSIKIGYATFFDHIPTTDLEREMAKRAGSNVTEIEASHAVFASQPEKVAEVIAKAARQIGK